MARRKNETQARDDTETTGQGDTGAQPQESKGRRRKAVPMGRITLSMERATINKLRHAAIEQGVQPCELVEEVLKPIIAPYVVQYRDKRSVSESGEAA